MSDPTRRRFWLLGLVALPLARAALAAESIHGANAIYIGPSVSVGWTVVRGASPAEATIRLRVVNTRHQFRFVALDGSNPFTQRRTRLVAAAPLADTAELAVKRARFAEFPSCEIRLYTSDDDAHANKPALTVFYLGVPDTTPEFTDAKAADAYLDRVLKR